MWILVKINYKPIFLTEILKSKSTSQLPPIESLDPKVPIESIVYEYFNFKEWYCFVAADRLLIKMKNKEEK